MEMLFSNIIILFFLLRIVETQITKEVIKSVSEISYRSMRRIKTCQTGKQLKM